MHNIYKIMSM